MKPEELAAYGKQLALLLDRIDREEERLRDEVKERKGAIAKLRKEAMRLRGYCAERDGPQLDFGQARRVARRECPVCHGEGGNPGNPCTTCGGERTDTQ